MANDVVKGPRPHTLGQELVGDGFLGVFGWRNWEFGTLGERGSRSRYVIVSVVIVKELVWSRRGNERGSLRWRINGGLGVKVEEAVEFGLERTNGVWVCVGVGVGRGSGTGGDSDGAIAGGGGLVVV